MDTNPAQLPADATTALQKELAQEGFYLGPISGVWDAACQSAWEKARDARIQFSKVLPDLTLTDAVRIELEQWFAGAQIKPGCEAEIKAAVRAVLYGRVRYAAVESATGVPWWFVALIHGREASYSFKLHLHNGDPLSARTVNVPAGRPVTGHPPFDWAYSAADALVCDHLTTWTDWSLAGALHRLESFNGFGYRKRGLPSPYLWSYTTAGRGGKFVRDGVFDPAARDGEPGCAAVLKGLVAAGTVKL